MNLGSILISVSSEFLMAIVAEIRSNFIRLTTSRQASAFRPTENDRLPAGR